MTARPSGAPEAGRTKRAGNRNGTIICGGLLAAAYFCALFLVASPASALASGDIDQLKTRARSAALWQSPQWRAFLHYRGDESVIDEPKYFLSVDGKTNAEAELIASIDALFAPLSDGHAACRFAARYEWLEAELGFKGAVEPMRDCPEFRQYMEALAPRSATLVFPESYINSPASLFGHTLLRLDSQLESKLVSFAINYAARTGQEPGALYAMKGIVGMYDGYYTVHPYFKRLNTYGNIENRDIWEYELDLTEDEVRRLALHVWELRDMGAEYYFFDENCSYALLFLIEAARPRLSLTRELDAYWVIPLDTIRAIDGAGLIKSRSYRPSRATRIRSIAGELGAEHLDNAIRISSGNGGAIANIGAMELEFASEYLQYLRAEGKVGDAEYRQRLLEILGARSALGQVEYAVTEPVNPLATHLSAQASTGVGFSGGRAFGLLYARPAYHGLLDPPAGLREGASILFAQTEARLYDGSAELSRFALIDIASISPADRVFKPFSWMVSAGYRRELTSDDERPGVLWIETGGGMAAHGPLGALYYSMLRPAVKTDHEMGYALGAGLSIGALKRIDERFPASLEARAFDYMAGHKHRQMEIEFRQGVPFGAGRYSLYFSLKGSKLGAYSSTEGSVSVGRFF